MGVFHVFQILQVVPNYAKHDISVESCWSTEAQNTSRPVCCQHCISMLVENKKL